MHLHSICQYTPSLRFFIALFCPISYYHFSYAHLCLSYNPTDQVRPTSCVHHLQSTVIYFQTSHAILHVSFLCKHLSNADVQYFYWMAREKSFTPLLLNIVEAKTAMWYAITETAALHKIMKYS